MINIKKVAHQIKFDGMYNTVLNEIEEKFDNDNLTVQEIENILKDNEYFVLEYKELNRYGSFVYIGYSFILAVTYWAYRKAKDNHESQHAKYKTLHKETRVLVNEGLEKNYFTYDEFYQGI